MKNELVSIRAFNICEIDSILGEWSVDSTVNILNVNVITEPTLMNSYNNGKHTVYTTNEYLIVILYTKENNNEKQN